MAINGFEDGAISIKIALLMFLKKCGNLQGLLQGGLLQGGGVVPGRVTPGWVRGAYPPLTQSNPSSRTPSSHHYVVSQVLH